MKLLFEEPEMKVAGIRKYSKVLESFLCTACEVLI